MVRPFSTVTTRMQHVKIRLTTGKHKNIFFMDVALLSISPANHGQLVKMLTTLELYMVYLFKHCPVIGLQTCDEVAGKI